MAQSTVWKHLSCLWECGLVDSRPVGRASPCPRSAIGMSSSASSAQRRACWPAPATQSTSARPAVSRSADGGREARANRPPPLCPQRPSGSPSADSDWRSSPSSTTSSRAPLPSRWAPRRAVSLIGFGLASGSSPQPRSSSACYWPPGCAVARRTRPRSGARARSLRSSSPCWLPT
nr:hypothetical protein [Modestobacter marinus]